MLSQLYNFGETPFKNKTDIHEQLIADFGKVITNDGYLQKYEIQEKVNALCKWMCTTPRKSIYRLDHFSNHYTDNLQKLYKALKQADKPDPSIHFLPDLPNGIVAVENWDLSVSLDLKRYPREIMVDAICGAAVLRGSHVYAPGVIGMPNGLIVNCKVSVFADVIGHCKKGLIKPYPDSKKIYLGNGILRQTRKELFGKAKNPCGIAIIMTDVTSRVPQLNTDNESLRSHVLLQNLPSILCSLVLNPQPGETVLDMCAAPGNKTTHISFLMKGQGKIIALEKNAGKVKRFKEKCNDENIKIFCYDATKAVIEQDNSFVDTDGPPFKQDHFDRILLDTPCSALGQRPQLYNTITLAQLRSYIPLQRSLFSAAVRLLKQNGTLVYSTCTVTIAENEGIIAWALKQFPELKLESVTDRIKTDRYGSQGYTIDGLTNENARKENTIEREKDNRGLLEASAGDIIHNAKRKCQLERKQGTRLGMMRHLYIILDASKSMPNQDLKSTWFLCSLKIYIYGKCNQTFCLDCEIFIHEILHTCPDCTINPAT